jgi:hypothetical protein
VGILEKIVASPDFLRQVYFSDEATFHDNATLNKYNCRIWGIQSPHVTCELEGGSPKANVWAGCNAQFDWTVFFWEKTVTGRSCLGMLELYALSQLPPESIL